MPRWDPLSRPGDTIFSGMCSRGEPAFESNLLKSFRRGRLVHAWPYDGGCFTQYRSVTLSKKGRSQKKRYVLNLVYWNEKVGADGSCHKENEERNRIVQTLRSGEG